MYSEQPEVEPATAVTDTTQQGTSPYPSPRRVAASKMIIEKRKKAEELANKVITWEDLLTASAKAEELENKVITREDLLTVAAKAEEFAKNLITREDLLTVRELILFALEHFVDF